MNFFDSHAHYDDPRFAEDREVLLPQLHSQGVDYLVNIGCNRESSLASVLLAETYDFIYAAVGWHPEFAGEFGPESLELLRELAKQPKVRAIGEIGIDYHYMDAPKQVQLEAFDAQMALAEELSLPVVIHQREGIADCLEVVRRHPKVTGVFHCYSGSAQTAKELLSRGYYLGFTGVITFKNARKSLEALKMAPPDRILLETDCPYLAPVPFRGKRNHSGLLIHTLEAMAQTRNISAQEAAQLTLENAKRFYRIP